MSSVFYINNVTEFIGRVSGRKAPRVAHLKLARVAPDTRSVDWLFSVPGNEAEIRLRSDTDGTLRREAAVKSRNELI